VALWIPTQVSVLLPQQNRHMSCSKNAICVTSNTLLVLLCQYHKNFLLLAPTPGENKLACLSLTRFFMQVKYLRVRWGAYRLTSEKGKIHGFIRVGFGLTEKFLTCLKNLVRGKCTSLFSPAVVDNERKFYNFVHRLTPRTEKLKGRIKDKWKDRVVKDWGLCNKILLIKITNKVFFNS
jgi:hypothetical protein